MAMKCQTCGDSTLGFTISKQGGTRTMSAAVPRSRGIYCKGCAGARIKDMDARDEKTRQANRRK